ncbi:diguanylate cyclase domain-containing protein [Glaciimonas sp. PCH181]|uniref:diguanylate cyclase domain-containing protein n=1 Tax=Glaciimonas sp. PCH181 TaxID=2133943 RepID=UPI000D357A98|nr:diguanylate cyclase [Glaciimonas sp. PCH181]PUA20212.1 hypothetical protein C7W93_10670 [Glaciimonas sp. PCH181]
MITIPTNCTQLWQKIRALCTFPAVNLRLSLIIGFGVVLGLFTLVGLLGIIGQRTTVGEFNKLLAVDIKTASLSQRSVVAMMTARRYEKAFLMTYHEFGFDEAKSRYVTLLQANLADARQALDEMRVLSGSIEATKEIGEAVIAIDRYEKAFLAVVNLHGKLGYIDTGLEGEFGNKARQIEALLDHAKEPALFVDLLTIRREEKNYLLRGRDLDNQATQGAITQFKRDIGASVVGSRRAKLIELADLYALRFGEYVETMHQIGLQKRSYLSAAQMVEPYLENLLSRALAKSDAGRDAIRKKAIRTEAIIEGVGFATILLGILIAWTVSMRITIAIRQTIAFAKGIAAGDLRTRSSYVGNDEFDVLGRSLNRMASALQDAIQSREQRAFELEEINGMMEKEIVARKQAEKDIRKANAELEQRVMSRTAELAKSEERFRRLADLSSDWYWELDENFRFIALTDGITKRSGTHIEHYIGKTRWEMPIALTPEQWASHKAILQAHLPFSDFEFMVQFDNVAPEWMSVSGEPQFDLQDVFTGYHGIGKDITERKQNEERIRHLSLHDVLTGLPNRALLQDRLKQALTYAARYSRIVWVLFMDLDEFKGINDTFGHKAGDKVLSTMARRLKAAIRESDTVARLGGDEFVMVLAEHVNGSDISSAVERIMKEMSRPLTVNGTEVYIGSSIGVATFPKDGTDANTLIECADAAMYQAKQSGRNNVQYYKRPQEGIVLSGDEGSVNGKLVLLQS